MELLGYFSDDLLLDEIGRIKTVLIVLRKRYFSMSHVNVNFFFSLATNFIDVPHLIGIVKKISSFLDDLTIFFSLLFLIR